MCRDRHDQGLLWFWLRDWHGSGGFGLWVWVVMGSGSGCDIDVGLVVCGCVVGVTARSMCSWVWVVLGVLANRVW